MSRGGGALLSWEEAGNAQPRMRSKAGAIILLALLPACSTAPERAPALGEGFVGPYELHVREALAARAKLADTVKHGERVEILGKRRSFYRIRTQRGKEGWVDARQLLSAQELEALRRLERRAAEAPSQGEATVMDVLNVHTAPHRQAPSFRRIQPGERVDVIAYERAPRRPYAPQPLLPAGNGARKEGARGKAQRKRKDRVEPPAAAPAPGLPREWMELSRTARPAETGRGDAAAPAAAAAVAKDEWALVRSRDGAAGWVLARMLFLAIPDEVGQYAERARIVAYFAAGSVRGRDGDKPVWLWAAQSQRDAEHDFDSLRIFVWSARRNRYETAFIERGLRGDLPVRLKRGGAGVEGFEVDVLEKSGERVRRSYAVAAGTFRTKVARRAPAGERRSWLTGESAGPSVAGEEAPRAEGWRARLGGWMEALRAKFSR